nr:ankyrin repeat-containing protein [Tanacetum cinerariifolium]
MSESRIDMSLLSTASSSPSVAALHKSSSSPIPSVSPPTTSSTPIYSSAFKDPLILGEANSLCYGRMTSNFFSMICSLFLCNYLKTSLGDTGFEEDFSQAKVVIKIQAEDPGKGLPIDKLRDATREGNWWRAKSILRRNRYEITIKINDVGETMLHLAVREGKNYFVQRLLNSIQCEELIEEKNIKGQTALHIAALVGNTYAAKLLVKKRDNLLDVKDNLGKVPLLIAYTTNHFSTFAYLFEATKTADELLSKYQDSLEEFIIRLIYRKEYALAFKLYSLHLESTEKPTDKVLMAVTRNFPCDLDTWERRIYPLEPIKDIEKRKKEYGEANFFLDNAVLHIDSCKLDNKEFYKSIAFEAVRLDVYEVLRTTGAALQLQRELQWREEVEKFMEPMQLTDLNNDNETPDTVFTREHADLVNDGEKCLPRRLFIALGLLILSTILMISAFSAVFYLVFCDQRPWMVAPIGAFTCMPIAAIVSLQLPLVKDLYRSTCSSMFV